MPSSHYRNRSSKPQERAVDAGEQELSGSLSLFRARLAAGDYEAVIGKGLCRTLQGAAADATLEAEIGALRLALAKLLNEEDDPARLAAGVSRVAGVAVQAARLRNSASADTEGFRGTMLRVLEEVEKDHARSVGWDEENEDRNKEIESDDAD